MSQPAVNLHEIVADVLDLSGGEITDETGPKSLSVWDSLKHVEIIVTIEATYGVRFAPSEIVAIQNLADIRALLDDRGCKLA